MTKFQIWKMSVPYGRWSCANDREVLFNRAYWPILERTAGGPASAARPGEWIENIREEDFLFDDWSSPWGRRPAGRETIVRVNAVLVSWGLPVLPKRPRRYTPRVGPRVRWFEGYPVEAGLSGDPEDSMPLDRKQYRRDYMTFEDYRPLRCVAVRFDKPIPPRENPWAAILAATAQGPRLTDAPAPPHDARS